MITTTAILKGHGALPSKLKKFQLYVVRLGQGTHKVIKSILSTTEAMPDNVESAKSSDRELFSLCKCLEDVEMPYT